MTNSCRVKRPSIENAVRNSDRQATVVSPERKWSESRSEGARKKIQVRQTR